MWLPLKSIIKPPRARWECSKNPHLLRCEDSNQEGPAGTGQDSWEQPQRGWSHAAGLGWPGDIWGALPEVCDALAGMHTKCHEPSIPPRALRAVKAAPSHLQTGNGQSQIPGWRGRHTAQLLPHTFSVLSATSTKLAGVYNPASKAMKTRGQSPSSGAWPGVGLGPFTSNICDFCPGSYF